MRHYVPQKNNPYHLPHNLYMQMYYLIRDCDDDSEELVTDERKFQFDAVRQAERLICEEYKKRPTVCGTLESRHAFFDYAYFSYMFAQKGRDMGAGKRAWNLYRCRFAYLTAMFLGLLPEF